MPWQGDFEAGFFAALGALASLLVHAGAVLLFLGGPDELPEQPIFIELVSAPRERPPEERASQERAPTSAAASALTAPSADVDVPAPSALHDEDSRQEPADYRARLRQRERAFARDMAVRAERIAALERFLAEDGRNARGAVAPPADDVISLCGAHDAGAPVVVTAARSMARYADLTPVGLFPPRYLDEVAQVARHDSAQVARDGGALGRIEMALPAREVIVQLDEPAGAVFAIGRRDARCLVGFSWTRDVFPLRFRGLPARYVDESDDVRELVMDVVLHVDATFEVTLVSGDELPFARGALYDRDAVARNLEQRATGARVVRDFLGALLGGG